MQNLFISLQNTFLSSQKVFFVSCILLKFRIKIVKLHWIFMKISPQRRKWKSFWELNMMKFSFAFIFKYSLEFSSFNERCLMCSNMKRRGVKGSHFFIFSLFLIIMIVVVVVLFYRINVSRNFLPPFLLFFFYRRKMRFSSAKRDVKLFFAIE